MVLFPASSITMLSRGLLGGMGAVELNEPFGRHDSAFHTREGGCAALASVRLVNMRYPFGYRLKFEAGSVQWDACNRLDCCKLARWCLCILSFLSFTALQKLVRRIARPLSTAVTACQISLLFRGSFFCSGKHSMSSCRSLSQQFRPT